MNVAAGDAGARIVEVPVEMTHAATGRTLRGFAHRGQQFVHILGALLAAAFGRTGETVGHNIHVARFLAWLIAVFGVGAFSLLCAAFWLDDWQSRLNYHAVISLFWAAFLLGPLLTATVSGSLRARKKNFRGRAIPVLGGLLVLPASLFVLLVSLGLTDNGGMPARNQAGLLAIPLLLIGWMLLGLLDDVAGDAQRKGFKGHVRALLTGKLTTGGVKLLGGGVLALLMAWFIAGSTLTRWPFILLAALLIALSANTLNLFDLRPGRALKVFWLVTGVFVLATFQGIPDYHPSLLNLQLLAGMLLLATLVYAPLDFAGMMMLGDTGANPLGAFMGLSLAVALPWYGQLIAVLLLTGLHLYAERASITKLIDRTPWLRWLDGLGR